MNENKSNWNYSEFRIYLLLYAAHADFELKEEEKQRILTNATQDEYRHINKVFEKDSDFERIETILSFREQFFPTGQDTERLIKEIAGLLNADDEFNLYERNFLLILQKILRSK